MAFKKFFLDEIMDANDAEVRKATKGYKFSNGREFYGENDLSSTFTYSAGSVADTVVGAVQKLGIFQGTPWNDTVGVWMDTEVWIDG